MPCCCSVLGCKSNYHSQLNRGAQTVSTFGLPKDEELRKQWLNNIPNDLSKIKNPRICSNHFIESDIIRVDICTVKGKKKMFERKLPKLEPNAVPSIFGNTFCGKNEHLTESFNDTNELISSEIKVEQAEVVIDMDNGQYFEDSLDDDKEMMRDGKNFPEKSFEGIFFHSVKDEEYGLGNEFIISNIKGEKIENWREMEYSVVDNRDFPEENIEENCELLEDVKVETNDSECILSNMKFEKPEEGIKVEEDENFGDPYFDVEKLQHSDEEQCCEKDFIDYYKLQERNEDDSSHSSSSRKYISHNYITPENDLNSGGELKPEDNHEIDQKSLPENAEVKNYKCHLCNYITRFRYGLKRHIDGLHLGIKKEKCPMCDYSSSYKNTLKRHIDCCHLGIKDHKCHICDYETSKKYVLQKHIETVHLKINRLKVRFKCELCKFSANEEDDLQKHIEGTHLGIKSFKCDHCDYASFEKRKLTIHVDSVHLGLKNHKCEWCDYSTNHKSCLKRHVDGIHLKMKRHKCNLCEYGTCQKPDLKKHMAKVHKQEQK